MASLADRIGTSQTQYRPVTDAERVEEAKRYIRRLINFWDSYVEEGTQAIYDEVSNAWQHLDANLFVEDDAV